MSRFARDTCGEVEMAKSESRLFIALVSLLFLGGSAKAKDWHGLVPLQSTRSDVIRAFSHCADENPSCEFEIEDATIHIEFSRFRSNQPEDCRTKLPPDTILLIEVTPVRALKFKDLVLNKNLFRPFEIAPAISRKYRGYLDARGGLVIKTYEGKVVQLDYIASARQKHLCESYYRDPESFVQEIFLSHVPVIALVCPEGELHVGDELNFSAAISGTPRISFLWTVSAGRIIDGQGTRQIRVSTVGVNETAIKATVSLRRIASSCEVQLSQ